MGYKQLSSILFAASMMAGTSAYAASTVDLTTAGQSGSTISFNLSVSLDAPTWSGWLDIGYNTSLLSFAGASGQSDLWVFERIEDNGTFLDVKFESVSDLGESFDDPMLTLNFNVIGSGSDMLIAAHHNASNSFVNANTSQEIPVIFGGASYTVTAVPVPAAVWLFGSGLVGLAGVARRKVA